MEKACDIQVYGDVQGVGFRAAARRKAKALGLRGVVKNLPEGSVYIEAEGNAQALTQLIEWCHSGGVARIQKLVIYPAQLRSYQHFKVKT